MGKLSPTPKEVLKVVLLLLFIISTMILMFYHILILGPDGQAYRARLQPTAAHLRNKCDGLAKATEGLLFDAHPSTDAQIADMQKLSARIEKIREALQQFRETAGTLPHHSYTFGSSSYRQSLTLKTQSSAIANQIQEVLDEYRDLLTFLPEYIRFRDQLTNELAAFNSQTDFDALSGQSEAYSQTAVLIRQRTEAISKQTAPRGFNDLINKAVTLHLRIADAYESLSRSLFPPIESAIDISAQELERLTNENDVLNTDTLTGALEVSPVLKGVNELPEKVDSLKF